LLTAADDAYLVVK